MAIFVWGPRNKHHSRNIPFLCLQSLVTMAADNEGSVVCPRTREIYTLEDAEKVFVM